MQDRVSISAQRAFHCKRELTFGGTASLAGKRQAIGLRGTVFRWLKEHRGIIIREIERGENDDQRTDLRLDSESCDRDLQSGSVKARFKATCDIFFEDLHATLDSQLIEYFARKAPAGRLSGSKPNI